MFERIGTFLIATIYMMLCPILAAILAHITEAMH